VEEDYSHAKFHYHVLAYDPTGRGDELCPAGDIEAPAAAKSVAGTRTGNCKKRQIVGIIDVLL
jgi:hypothetical protein